MVRLRQRLETASEKLQRARRDARDAHGESGRAQRSLKGAEEELATHRSAAALAHDAGIVSSA